ncbi:MAG: hypothetical protein U0Y68_10115 [Blastocatellia bacterium]
MPFTQSNLQTSGHAIEARLYAEDPGNDFLPATGTIYDWLVPTMDGLRIDAGVEQGSVIGINYDPLLAKLIAHGATRAEAIRKLLCAATPVHTGRDDESGIFVAFAGAGSLQPRPRPHWLRRGTSRRTDEGRRMSPWIGQR